MVWIAISSKGVSKPYFRETGNAINQYVYMEHCIQKRLKPFIEQHHVDEDFVFQPDLASAHYAKIVLDYLKAKKVEIVPREDNPPNLSECRPIENFWSILKGLVYENNWHAETLEQLKERIKYCLTKVGPIAIQETVGCTKRLIDHVRPYGVIESN